MDEQGDLNLGRVIRLLFLQSKLIISISLIGLILGLGNYLLTEKQYRVSSLLQLQNTNNSPFNSSTGLNFLASGSSQDVNLLTDLYKTRTNILKIVKNFNLNIFFEDPSQELEFYEIELSYLQQGETQEFFYKTYNNFYEIYDEDKNLIIKNEYSKLYLNEESSIKINIKKPLILNQNFKKFIYLHPEDLYSYYYNNINIEVIESSSFYSNDGLIRISMISPDPEKAKSIINFANKNFLDISIRSSTEEARKAIIFIDKQLDSLSEILTRKKQNLKNFKEENQSVNVDLEIKSIIETITKIEEDVNKVDIELAEASSLYTQSNPILKNMNDRKDILLSQKENIEQRIRNLPIAEQQYIDLFRDVEISQELFLELTNRKVGFSIMEASNIGSIRIIDEAFREVQTSPRLIYAIVVFLVFFAVSVFIALLRGAFFLKISNPAELNDSGIDAKIFGVIPKVEIDLENTAKEIDDINFMRSVESTIINIKSAINEKDSNVILFTSPSPSNGKSLISRTFAKRLSEMGHKTLLIDNDLIRGDQHKALKLRKIEPSKFFNLNKDNIKDIEFNENFYVIPKIKGLNDTFNFFYNDSFHSKISEFKNIFDYIIIDTAPILSVSDTSILMSYADLNMLIVRHEISSISQIKQSVFMSDQISHSFDGIIYNDYSRSNSYFGYYDLYGDYRYRYYADKYLYSYGYTEVKDD